MMLYVVINVGVAAVLLAMGAASRLATSFRDRLVLSRALLCATLATSAAVSWFVQYAGLTWSFETELFTTSSSGDSSFPILASLLVVVASFRLARELLAYRDLSAMLQSGVVIRRLGSVVIVASDRIDVPCAARTLRSRWVVLPTYLLGKRDDLRFAISHELQHHRHGDTTWAWVTQSLTTVLWPNPVIHVWRRWHSAVQELACDEALRERSGFDVAGYARCLLDVAEHALDKRLAYRLAPSMATRTTQLGSRIELLFAATRRRVSRPLLATAFIIAICLGVCASGLAAGWTAQQRSAAETTSAVQPDDEIPCEDSLALECR